MSSSRITLLGLENYMSTLPGNRSIFENMTMPAGIDTDTLKDNILIKAASFEVLYPDPDFMSYSVGVWARKWNPTFRKWQEALNIKYDPLYNYDRTEEWNETYTGSDSRNTNRTHSDTETGSDVDSSVTSLSGAAETNTSEDKSNTNVSATTSEKSDNRSDSATESTVNESAASNRKDTISTEARTGSTADDSTTTNSVSAYNSSVFENDTKSVIDSDNSTESAATGTANESGATSGTETGTKITSNSGSGSGTETGTTSGTETGTTTGNEYIENMSLASEQRRADNERSYNGSNTDSTMGEDEHTITHQARMFGNIGVTTSQQMLESELEIAEWNLIEHITDIFLQEFIIPVY